MVNPQRGEVSIQVGDATYTLQATTDALCQIEGVLGRSVLKIIADMSDPETATLTTLRGILWGLLRAHHKEITLVQAGDLIVPAGGFLTVLEKVNEAMAMAFPVPKAGDDPPPKPGQS